MADNQAPDYMAQYDYAANEYNPDGRLIDALKSTWKPTDPVKLQSMDQMLSGDASGKDFNPTEHGYKWNGAGFVNPNGSTISVNPDGSVSQATPAYKDYEFNGQYWNPAGENIAWHPDTNTSAYKIDGVEVPINRENMKGIAAYTDSSGKPQMQISKEGVPVFTEPEGTRFTGDWVNTYAPYITSALLGGTTAVAAGAFGAGTTLAGEAAAAGGANAATAGLDLGTNFSGSAYGNGANAASAGINLGTNFAGPAYGNGANVASAGLDLGTNFTGPAYDGVMTNAAPYAGDSKYAAQDVMQQSRDTAMSSGPTAWDTGKAGLSTLQKAMLIRSGLNAFSQMTGGGGTSGGGGGGAGSNYNYTNYPYLANPQQNTIQMKTGRDVSGTGTTTAGYPVGLDTSRQAALMANLLRG